ncbi:MAG: ABC transporter permease [Acidobacteriia bacterium]|nr:ABC transporter permease [Terriglobia bacterium]
MGGLFRRLDFLLHRRRFEQELDEEMRHHQALQREAKRDGARPFGNVTLLKEDCRTMWIGNFFTELSQDARYAVRMIGANRLFAGMALISLALGIGANTAIYSFMEAILLRPLPVSHPEELVVLRWCAKGPTPVVKSVNGTWYRDAGVGRISPNFPFAAYEVLRGDGETFSALFAFVPAEPRNAVVRGQAEVLRADSVSGNYYSSLGVTPAAGRLISTSDDRAGAAPVAVLSYQYWESRFGLDPAAVGQRILINNTPVTIVGVSAPGFAGMDPGVETAITLPLHTFPLFAYRPGDEQRRRFFDANFYWVEMMGRLRTGVTMEQAQSRLAARFRQFAETTASRPSDKTSLPLLAVGEGRGGRDSLRRQYSQAIFVLMTMVGLILALACANIANLLLARGESRSREIAVRLSLGAGRWRIVRQLLTESVLLSCLGGALGLLVAFWGIRSITWLLANGRADLTLRASLNLPVLGFTAALSLATGLLFGLAPALRATRGDLTPALKAARTTAPVRRPGLPIGLGQILVVAQVGISLALVIGAGLFVHTLSNLNAVRLGFQRENVLLFHVNARPAGYRGAALARFYGGLSESFRAIPGVRSAAFSDYPLASQYWNGTGVVIPGVEPQPGKPSQLATMSVDPSFLSTMAIPILAGRGIEKRDLRAPRVAVVNEQFAKEFLGNANPVGRFIGIGDARESPAADIEIIGVAGNAVYNSIKEEKPPALAYLPYTQNPDDLSGVYFELRTAGAPLARAESVRRVLRAADPLVPLTDISTQDLEIDSTIGRERTLANLGACFGALALVIACIGLYGTIAYSVARRTGEIGIRLALGARRGSIVWMVLRQVVALAGAGLVIGFAAAWETTRFVQSFLFGAKPNDPLALSVAVVILGVAALAAGYAPARRAARMDPMAALRCE